jgi:branched-chain amino acid transport system ATP-binding protein
MLQVRGLHVSYGPVPILSGIDFTVGDGEIVAFIGPNGAGKTTTLNAIAGLVPRTGDVLLDGEPLPLAAEQVVRRGVALVPQGRRIFPGMTVEENLYMGAYARGGTWRDADRRFAPVYEIFPRLAERRRQTASSLSGGEQQMLVIGRALLSEPTVLLIDELSLGLAPRRPSSGSTPNGERPACSSSRPPPPPCRSPPPPSCSARARSSSTGRPSSSAPTSTSCTAPISEPTELHRVNEGRNPWTD